MKKEYEAPKAEKFAFDFSENVTASSVSYATTDDSNDYWEVLFSRCRYGVEKTVSEFENYLICLENL